MRDWGKTCKSIFRARPCTQPHVRNSKNHFVKRMHRFHQSQATTEEDVSTNLKCRSCRGVTRNLLKGQNKRFGGRKSPAGYRAEYGNPREHQWSRGKNWPGVRGICTHAPSGYARVQLQLRLWYTAETVSVQGRILVLFHIVTRLN